MYKANSQLYKYDNHLKPIIATKTNNATLTPCTFTQKRHRKKIQKT